MLREADRNALDVRTGTPRSGRTLSTLIGLVAAGMMFSAAAQACPFCSAPSMTLTEQLASAQSAVLVQWAAAKPAVKEDGFIGSTDYEILQVVHDESRKLVKGEKIVLERQRSGKPGELFLLLGTVIDERVEWNSPLEVTETAFNYVVQAPSSETPVRTRLAYFMKFLEYPDPLIAGDAYGEFANAPYEDIVPLADQMPREKLREWLSDSNVTATRYGLYGLMLGLCGQADDAIFLKDKILEETEDFRLGIDGIMAGYMLLTGADGLEVISEQKIRSTKVPFSETFAAMQALRFMWTYGNGRISADKLRAAMRLLLDRPNLADLVIVDLARWNDWSVMDRLMSMYTQPEYDVASIKRAIVRFLLIAEKSGGETEKPSPEVIEKAKAHLAQLRETDPKTVKTAERFFFD